MVLSALTSIKYGIIGNVTRLAAWTLIPWALVRYTIRPLSDDELLVVIGGQLLIAR